VFDQPGGTELARVVSDDATYGSGVSGVIVNRGETSTDALRGTFDNVVSQVPEPTSWALMAIGGLLLTLGYRRRGRWRLKV